MAPSSNGPLYAGFDLGTTNSAAAVFDGERIEIVRNSQGGALTPSVVRIDRRGHLTVGMRARRFLERDPENTCAEFKRLMGTDQPLRFSDADVARRPEELAAEVLRAMRADVRDQFGVLPERAVISVPALFEIPQSAATAEAARLAGFERVELLQEPIASALAAGWRADDPGGAWLVYDIGGGTFDVSLLESRDGLLRVVGHDGDNFLGGRDFDGAVVDWMIARLADDEGVELDRADPACGPALRALRLAAEEAKIELSRRDEAVIALPAPLRVPADGGTLELDVELTLDRATLEALCTPIIDRSLAVCRRLLAGAGMEPAQLGRMVLVGGPTVMPHLRERLADTLAVPIAEGHDPMTLVAQGAAIYAATAGLDARPVGALDRVGGRHLWLQYPAVSSDLTPHVVGRIAGGDGPAPARIRLVRDDGQWQSPEAEVDGEGAFVLITDLVPRRPNIFKLEAAAVDGAPVPVRPAAITIVQGLTIGDPPLSRTVGVALADDRVSIYFERGVPLPARRTFTHQTVQSVARGSGESLLVIPIVQGEFEQAHLCRLVGRLEIKGDAVTDSLPAGSDVELTIELDRGGRLSARALVPALGQVFEEVAHLLVPDADPEVLDQSAVEMRRRIGDLRGDAFRQGWTKVLDRLEGAEVALADAQRDVAAARGGDADAAQKARRTLLELDATLAAVELERRWPELEDRARRDLAWAVGWVSEYGSPTERQLLDEVTQAIARAREERNVGELQRQLRVAARLGNAAFYRHPDVWEWLLDSAAAEVSDATDLPRAEALVRKGRAAKADGDRETLRRAVEQLWKLLPADAQSRRLSFDSGVR